MSAVFTAEQLAKHDGTDPSLPIYVAIKGRVFDVSGKKEMYGPGAGYHVFAGKDASKALGKSSLKPEDCVADCSSLDEKEQKVLDDWVIFFEKRYPVVGNTA
ncbi:membrane-associated progesterone receptor component [Entomortierella parvispora]|uniref:Membrane-associated progesterone receptor component n=1 Tax=Entomortierella parvispora TaxID=205924 RepID=A0A9P3HAB1_9FUNG|nr:membrane-associated progesterone receptor component [Entomortierella parvispora]